MKSKKLKIKIQNPNSNHGITLIALIITIVVMLILVAVTLSIALGENGIVNNAKKAARDTNSVMANETDIANDVTYEGVQGIDNIINHITKRVNSKKLKVGDKVTVKAINKISNKIESITKNMEITFDNNMKIMFYGPTADGMIGGKHIEIGHYTPGAGEMIVSEESPLYLYLQEGTTVLGTMVIENEGWYRVESIEDITNLNELMTTELPEFEANIRRIGYPNSVDVDGLDISPDCDIYDTYIVFYK